MNETAWFAEAVTVVRCPVRRPVSIAALGARTVEASSANDRRLIKQTGAIRGRGLRYYSSG